MSFSNSLRHNVAMPRMIQLTGGIILYIKSTWRLAAARSGQLVTGTRNKNHHCKQHAKERSCAYTFDGNPPIDVTDETEKISTVGGIFTLVKQKMPAIVTKTDVCHTVLLVSQIFMMYNSYTAGSAMVLYPN